MDKDVQAYEKAHVAGIADIGEADAEQQDGTLAIEGSTRWWTDEEDRAVRRKLDFHVVPFLFITYALAFLDRGNIGNANTAGLSKSLHLTDAQYQWLLTIFYIAYICFQFLLLGYKVFAPSKFMGCCVMLWGIAAIMQGAAYNWSGMMAARWFIGLAEAGYGTGVALYLSTLYPRNEIGGRFAGFIVGSSIASAIAGSVAYGLQKAHTAVASWKLILIVEGAPTIILGVVIFFFLPDSIATARFLSPRERQIAEARLYRAAIDRKHAADPNAKPQRGLSSVVTSIRESLNLKNGLEAFKDPISYVAASLLFIVNTSFSSIPVYLPTILTGMGYTSLRAQAFSAPPYLGAFVLAIVFSILSDRLRVRGLILACFISIGLAGYVILATVTDNHTRYGAVWLVVCGLFTSVPILYMWLVNNQTGESKKGFALILFGTVGQCGPLLGTRLYPAAQAPYYRHGMYTSVGLLCGALCIIFAGLCYVFFANRRKDREMAALEQEALREKMGTGGQAGTDDDKADSAHSSDHATLPNAALRFKRHLDKSNPAERDEMHRRLVDIAIHREASVYWRYSY